MTYELRKGREGWEARSTIPLGGAYALKLSTYKGRRGGVLTIATRVELGEDGSYTFWPFSDYSKAVSEDRSVKVTEKAVKVAHEAALAKVEEIKAAVAAFYAAKAKEDA